MATDVTSTNNGDTQIASDNATTNYSSQAQVDIERRTTGMRVEGLISFTLPAGSGIISLVKLFMYKINNAGQVTNDTTLTANVYKILRTDTSIAQTTYNIYKTSNNWTTAGALSDGNDYSSTIIDTVPVTSTYPAWNSFVLMGTGSDNPLTLTWGDTVILKLDLSAQPAVLNTGVRYASKENADSSKYPYIEITYTTTSIKSINGLAKASVKSFNGLAGASIKNINGLS